MNNIREKWMTEFLENSVYRLDESTRMNKISLKSIEESNIWRKPNESSNSIGNQIMHICGNMTQYIIASLGGLHDQRNRDAEFSITNGFTSVQLLQKLENTVDQAKNVLKSCSKSQLLQKREVQGFDLSGIGIVIHAVEHYSYHTGQIAFWTKMLVNKDLGFYDGRDLNIKNKN
ncbi:DinB family protein [Eudoraea adriatica]|uniref:DinB family protein n=1 Tax=Eudoraea adriatica TaxID=446681 RepID=UPI000360F061|nr:DinB family protein [Eudoraea adriatica]